MLLWSMASGISLAVVLLWALAELYAERHQGAGELHDHIVRRVLPKIVLFIVLAVAIHAAIDPEHDRNRLDLHTSQIDRAVYAFAVTASLLVAFPTLRIGAGVLLVGLTVSLAEIMQWVGVLPGIFRAVDWLSGLVGVVAAAGLMWLGAQRARRNMALEQEAARRKG